MDGRRGKWVTEAVADEQYCMLEVGLKWYFFKVERYLDDSLSVHLDWKIEKTKSITRHQRVGVSPMTFLRRMRLIGGGQMRTWIYGLKKRMQFQIPF